MSRTLFVIGNWKMNPLSLREAQALARKVALKTARLAPKRGKLEVGIAVPALYLGVLGRAYRGRKLLVGAQTVHHEAAGAYTGEVSLPMLRNAGAGFVIVGHSERRALGEDNALVARKMRAALGAGMRTVLCVGEHSRDGEGAFLEFVAEQVRSALAGIPVAQLGKLSIAYEPIWAIGTGKNATPHDAHEMALFIRKLLAELAPKGPRVPILYGGSVNGENIAALARDAGVDGFLVGGASLNADEFAAIVHAVAAA